MKARAHSNRFISQRWHEDVLRVDSNSRLLFLYLAKPSPESNCLGQPQDLLCLHSGTKQADTYGRGRLRSIPPASLQ